MQFADYKRKTARTNILSAVDIAGSFDFYTSIVSLDALSERDIIDVRNVFGKVERAETDAQSRLSPEQYTAAAKVLPLAVHEYTHFLDATSTIWGLTHLQLMNDGYLCSDHRGGNESNFSDAKKFHDYARRIRLPNYYTVVQKHTENRRPWQSRITVGKLFTSSGELSEQPVLFARFSNASGEPLARSPVSTVSLLEASAMAQELQFQAMLLQSVDPNFRMIEERHFTARTVEYLYDPQITEYSVCAHILANAQGCPDVLVTFGMCATLTRIALNFPSQAFERIADTCPISELVQVPNEHELVSALRRGLASEDRGILYYLLCMALPERSYLDSSTFRHGYAAAVTRLGLDIEALEQLTRESATQIAAILINSEIKPIRALAEAGLGNFELVSQENQRIDFSKLHLPPAMLGDSTKATLFNSPANKLRDFDIDGCFDELYRGQSWIERFSEACV